MGWLSGPSLTPNGMATKAWGRVIMISSTSFVAKNLFRLWRYNGFVGSKI
jgi:hypothetical protein